MTSNSAFLAELALALPSGTHMWVCGFIEEPSGSAPWRGAPYNTGVPVDAWNERNTYFSVAALKPDAHGDLARKRACFARLLALVVDDADLHQLRADPSWILETSPGKHQVGVLLDENDDRCADQPVVESVMKELVRRHLLGDASGNNLVRYVRLPVGTNTKRRETGPFPHRLRDWNPRKRYSLEDACGVWGMDLAEIVAKAEHRPQRCPAAEPSAGEQAERMRSWVSKILDGNELHESINCAAASLLSCGLNPGRDDQLDARAHAEERGARYRSLARPLQ